MFKCLLLLSVLVTVVVGKSIQSHVTNTKLYVHNEEFRIKRCASENCKDSRNFVTREDQKGVIRREPYFPYRIRQKRQMFAGGLGGGFAGYGGSPITNNYGGFFDFSFKPKPRQRITRPSK